MWGPKPAEAIIDSIHAKGYIRTFTPLATMLLALAGTAMYVANYGTKARNLRKDQSSSSEPGQFQAVQGELLYSILTAQVALGRDTDCYDLPHVRMNYLFRASHVSSKTSSHSQREEARSYWGWAIDCQRV